MLAHTARAIFALLAGLLVVACGGDGPGPSPGLISTAHAAAPASAATVEVAHLHAVLRPDSSGRWFVQSDVDHMPIGILRQVEQGPDFVRIFFDRTYTHAGSIQVTSDDDFMGTISGYSNLGLNNATIRIVANGRVIDPATVLAFVPPGSGNLWITVTMVNKPRSE